MYFTAVPYIYSTIYCMYSKINTMHDLCVYIQIYDLNVCSLLYGYIHHICMCLSMFKYVLYAYSQLITSRWSWTNEVQQVNMTH